VRGGKRRPVKGRESGGWKKSSMFKTKKSPKKNESNRQVSKERVKTRHSVRQTWGPHLTKSRKANVGGKANTNRSAHTRKEASEQEKMGGKGESGKGKQGVNLGQEGGT